MATFLTLDYQHIKARFPKAVEKIKEWFFEQPWMVELTKAQFESDSIPEDLKEHATGVIIQMDPRKLYDIFDQFGVFIGIEYSDGGFWSDIVSNNITKVSGLTSTRIQAEQTAFEDGFDILEKQLS